ncbi:serine/threonine-protein phosphatase 2 [Acinetobacter sp. ANC 4177]|nr:serine/threonine-protein phosphatase 2 [Acinetobacter sp. ANC 4177]
MIPTSELDLFPENSLIEEFDASHIQRLFVVGDLHGCYVELMDRLSIINFDFSKDLLISVGDLIDKGRDSLKCLELTKEPWFKAIRGNHEQMCLEAKLASEMISVHCQHGGEWLYKLPFAVQLDCLDLCLNLPIILEVNFKGKLYGFVHADIDFNDWQKFKKSILKNDYFTNYKSSTLQNALWGRSRITQSQNTRKYKSVYGIDEIYLGHTTVQEPIQLNNCFYIETGAFMGNNLTIKELIK